MLLLPSQTVDPAATATPYSDATQVGATKFLPPLRNLISTLEKSHQDFKVALHTPV